MNNLEMVKGIGVSTIKYLNEIGIYNVDDLVNYFPFRYEKLEYTKPEDIRDQAVITVFGICESKPLVQRFSSKFNKMSFRFNTSGFMTNVSIFNRSYLKDKLMVGANITVTGKYDKKKNMITASDIKLGFIDKALITPVYHASFKINSNKISKIIKSIIYDVSISETLPLSIISKYHFLSRQECIRTIHDPKDFDSLNKALDRLKYEELFDYMLKISYLKMQKHREKGLKRDVSYDDVLKFIDLLPFELTSDQSFAIKEIYNDLISPYSMNRLLQGDVGSGKTIVSFAALYINYLGGYQGALMAPTEILAQQHYENIKKILPNLNVVLLTGHLKAKEKREAKKMINDGADIIIGTHALISEDVVYKNLGLVITDEQHRFGVNQRGNLRNKGVTPDILYMSATPIPRTYALTLYGDMDISSIKSMPSGRKPVYTTIKTNEEIKDVLYMMLDEIKRGHQVYVVVPLIEDSEKIDLENVYNLEEKMKRAFGKICNIGVLHGKMSSKEKDLVMEDFKAGLTKILISTTVIEVGVDVFNATMMVIFDSYRFGLSALHQLRGRVGRNSLSSTCVLISDKETQRLKILTQTNDGFKVSEEDFKLRGGGDIFGVRQSGDMDFKLANIKNDYDLLLKAKSDAENFLKSDNDILKKVGNIINLN